MKLLWFSALVSLSKFCNNFVCLIILILNQLFSDLWMILILKKYKTVFWEDPASLVHCQISWPFELEHRDFTFLERFEGIQGILQWRIIKISPGQSSSIGREHIVVRMTSWQINFDAIIDVQDSFKKYIVRLFAEE